MQKDGDLSDFDDEHTFRESEKRAVNGSTHNFVVQFGEKSAEIGFNYQADGIKDLLNSPAPAERPVRWM